MIVKGYRGNLSAEHSQELASRGIYVFNSLCVGCREHLEWAYMKANNAFEKKRNIAKKKHLEMMLILSGRRQIKEAIKLCGTKDADSIVAISKDEFEISLIRDDGVVEFTEAKIKYLGIQFTDAKCDIMFENSAMLELER